MESKRELDIGDGVALRTFVENSGKIIAAITLIVSALVTFTNVSFSAAFTESFTCQMLIMLLSSYLMYFSMEEAGERGGEATELYREAQRRYDERRSEVSASEIPRLRAFLKRYSEEDRKYRQQLLLLRFGLSEEDYERYKRGEAQTKRERRALRRVDRVRPVRLLPHTLLDGERRDGRSELSSPEGNKLLCMLLRLIPTTVCTVFTVSIMLTAKDELTASVIVEGILKICALPIIGFKGYSAGYKYTRGSKRAYLDTKSRIIEEFIFDKEK